MRLSRTAAAFCAAASFVADCAGCGRALTADEVGLTKKLINRGTDTFYCVTCLSAMFKVGEPLLYEKIEQFRAQGCMLFAGPDDEVRAL